MSTFKSPVKWSCCFPTYCPMVYGQIVNCFLARNPRPALKLVCFTLYMEIDVWKYYNELFCQSSQLKYGLSINVGLSVYCIWKICWKGSSLSFFLPEFSFKFISVWTHYLSHTDLPDFCWIEVWACSWVTIALKETNIVSQNHHKKSEIKENCFCRCKLTTQVWASPLRQGQYGKSWANESQGTSSLNNWKPERQKKQEISSGFCGKTCSEKRNWKKDNPVRLADYATVGSHRFEPFAFTKG